jgi:tellurite resistance protein
VASDAESKLIARAARSVRIIDAPAQAARTPSILLLAASSYGSRPAEDTTIPTGFDPGAVALFEAIIEAAYLVANADGEFDEDGRRVFEGILTEACGGAVTPQQIAALVAELHGRLHRDGAARRIASLAADRSKPEQTREVLRVAALVGQASHGASASEREVLAKIATVRGLGASDVDAALAHARSVLSSGDGASAPESAR